MQFGGGPPKGMIIKGEGGKMNLALFSGAHKSLVRVFEQQSKVP